MNQSIDHLLEEWEHEPGALQARIVETLQGREVIQMRVDLGILQLELTGRPDGARPNGFPTYFDYLKDLASKHGDDFELEEEQCMEADREFVQFYHRRICWLGLGKYSRAMKDADHTLALMDFVTEHSPSEEYTQAHEQYRGFVLFQRTQAAAALQIERQAPEKAIDAIRDGLDRMSDFFARYDAEEHMEEDGMVQHLRRMEAGLREEYEIGDTLKEQLDKAIANEDYERAAVLRDAILKESGSGTPPH